MTSGIESNADLSRVVVVAAVVDIVRDERVCGFVVMAQEQQSRCRCRRGWSRWAGGRRLVCARYSVSLLGVVKVLVMMVVMMVVMMMIKKDPQSEQGKRARRRRRARRREVGRGRIHPRAHGRAACAPRWIRSQARYLPSGPSISGTGPFWRAAGGSTFLCSDAATGHPHAVPVISWLTDDSPRGSERNRRVMS